jgi:hypothetical protein
MTPLDRRTLLAGALAMAALPASALAGAPASGKLAFTVRRNGRTIGEHRMTFVTSPDGLAVTTEVQLVIKLGPVPVFRYRHHAEERWRGGRIAELHTRSESNGKIEEVTAVRTAGAVIIDGPAGRITAPAAVAPLSHWNAAALAGPLFNPQTGKLLKVTCAPQPGREAVSLGDGSVVMATHWAVRGESQIDDYYDPAGAWLALKGVLPDKSIMDYQRV